MTEVAKYLIMRSVNVRDAMKKMDNVHSKILFVLDEMQSLYGAVSDGDLRRWILSEGAMDAPVEFFCNKNPIYFHENYVLESVKQIMLEKKIQCIPVLDQQNSIVDLLFWDDVFQEQSFKPRQIIHNPVVIMAGGVGSRLEPFTKILPKPLIPIGDKTILELIIDRFREYHVNKFYISLGHKSKIIKAFLEELNPSYQVEYIEENKPLGTIGSLSLVANLINEPVIVTNCDILIEADYNEFLNFHNHNGYDLTLVGSLMNYKIPYGICEIENGGKLKQLKEKPEYSHLVSTGMYILSKYAVSLIPPNTQYQITQLIEKLRESNRSVGVFPISENSWFDTGEWAEYHKVLKKMGFSQ